MSDWATPTQHPEHIKPLKRGSTSLDMRINGRDLREEEAGYRSYGREERTAQTSVGTTSYAATEVCVCGTVLRFGFSFMDPGAMMNEGSFANNDSGNTAPYSLAEIWPFPQAINGGGGLGLRSPQFGHGPGQFGDFPPGPNHGLGPSNSRKRRDSDDDSAKAVSTSNAANESDGKRVKATGNSDGKGEGEVSSGKPAEQSAKPPLEAPKQDYIHVRARRGQATDSHSLAERARREKISERMKILQDLVPGCNKVIGKALVLDEIINYIQSLQRQVEFLSMKLEAVNSRLNSGIEAFPSKDFGQQAFDPAGIPFGSQAPREYSRGSSPDWLHMQVGGGFERTT
ncbi:unnamed protein product [Sphenostylis stenocarpa]|uniref:BHLH domain-containing protein n=1 Tax=Sphenostylis stenocarpa TaxID=92480 RepID=A0AA86S2M7_9FABA|nr:unnamed protein product [Sphenostylis stenocarpa]